MVNRGSTANQGVAANPVLAAQQNLGPNTVDENGVQQVPDNALVSPPGTNAQSLPLNQGQTEPQVSPLDRAIAESQAEIQAEKQNQDTEDDYQGGLTGNIEAIGTGAKAALERAGAGLGHYTGLIGDDTYQDLSDAAAEDTEKANQEGTIGATIGDIAGQSAPAIAGFVAAPFTGGASVPVGLAGAAGTALTTGGAAAESSYRDALERTGDKEKAQEAADEEMAASGDKEKADAAYEETLLETGDEDVAQSAGLRSGSLWGTVGLLSMGEGRAVAGAANAVARSGGKEAASKGARALSGAGAGAATGAAGTVADPILQHNLDDRLRGQTDTNEVILNAALGALGGSVDAASSGRAETSETNTETPSADEKKASDSIDITADYFRRRNERPEETREDNDAIVDNLKRLNEAADEADAQSLGFQNEGPEGDTTFDRIREGSMDTHPDDLMSLREDLKSKLEADDNVEESSGTQKIDNGVRNSMQDTINAIDDLFANDAAYRERSTTGRQRDLVLEGQGNYSPQEAKSDQDIVDNFDAIEATNQRLRENGADDSQLVDQPDSAEKVEAARKRLKQKPILEEGQRRRNVLTGQDAPTAEDIVASEDRINYLNRVAQEEAAASGRRFTEDDLIPQEYSQEQRDIARDVQNEAEQARQQSGTGDLFSRVPQQQEFFMPDVEPSGQRLLDLGEDTQVSTPNPVFERNEQPDLPLGDPSTGDLFPDALDRANRRGRFDPNRTPEQLEAFNTDLTDEVLKRTIQEPLGRDHLDVTLGGQPKAFEEMFDGNGRVSKLRRGIKDKVFKEETSGSAELKILEALAKENRRKKANKKARHLEQALRDRAPKSGESMSKPHNVKKARRAYNRFLADNDVSAYKAAMKSIQDTEGKEAAHDLLATHDSAMARWAAEYGIGEGRVAAIGQPYRGTARSLPEESSRRQAIEEVNNKTLQESQEDAPSAGDNDLQNSFNLVDQLPLFSAEGEVGGFADVERPQDADIKTTPTQQQSLDLGEPRSSRGLASDAERRMQELANEEDRVGVSNGTGGRSSSGLFGNQVMAEDVQASGLGVRDSKTGKPHKGPDNDPDTSEKNKDSSADDAELLTEPGYYKVRDGDRDVAIAEAQYNTDETDNVFWIFPPNAEGFTDHTNVTRIDGLAGFNEWQKQRTGLVLSQRIGGDNVLNSRIMSASEVLANKRDSSVTRDLFGIHGDSEASRVMSGMANEYDYTNNISKYRKSLANHGPIKRLTERIRHQLGEAPLGLDRLSDSLNNTLSTDYENMTRQAGNEVAQSRGSRTRSLITEADDLIKSEGINADLYWKYADAQGAKKFEGELDPRSPHVRADPSKFEYEGEFGLGAVDKFEATIADSTRKKLERLHERIVRAANRMVIESQYNAKMITEAQRQERLENELDYMPRREPNDKSESGKKQERRGRYTAPKNMRAQFYQHISRDLANALHRNFENQLVEAVNANPDLGIGEIDSKEVFTRGHPERPYGVETIERTPGDRSTIVGENGDGTRTYLRLNRDNDVGRMLGDLLDPNGKYRGHLSTPFMDATATFTRLFSSTHTKYNLPTWPLVELSWNSVLAAGQMQSAMKGAGIDIGLWEATKLNMKVLKGLPDGLYQTALAEAGRDTHFMHQVFQELGGGQAIGAETTTDELAIRAARRDAKSNSETNTLLKGGRKIHKGIVAGDQFMAKPSHAINNMVPYASFKKIMEHYNGGEFKNAEELRQFVRDNPDTTSRSLGASRRMQVNFSRRGASRGPRTFIPFFNSAYQGADLMLRRSATPQGVIANSALALAGAASINGLLDMYQEDGDSKKEAIRKMRQHLLGTRGTDALPIGEFALPVDYSIQPFMTAGKALAAYNLGALDADEALSLALKSAKNSMTPFLSGFGSETNESSLYQYTGAVGQAFLPFFLDRNQYGRSIEPSGYIHNDLGTTSDNVPAYMNAKKGTPDKWKEVASMLYTATGGLVNLSPNRYQEAVRGASGGLTHFFDQPGDPLSGSLDYTRRRFGLGSNWSAEKDRFEELYRRIGGNTARNSQQGTDLLKSGNNGVATAIRKRVSQRAKDVTVEGMSLSELREEQTNARKAGDSARANDIDDKLDQLDAKRGRIWAQGQAELKRLMED